MKTQATLTALALCLASTLTFAATPTAPPTSASASANTKHAAPTHCAKGYMLEHGKCVAKDKPKS